MGDTYFVGRADELKAFTEFLRDPNGQAALVIGHEGLGKTALLGRVAQMAVGLPDLRCGAVRYRITPETPFETTATLMLDDAMTAGQCVAGSFAATPRRAAQWRALIDALVPKGEKLRKLFESLRYVRRRHKREELTEHLELVSRLLDDEARVLFVIDPEKYMRPGSEDEWRLVVEELPSKIKFVFAQRPDDRLAVSSAFLALDNAVKIPPEPLSPLDQQSVDELIDYYGAQVTASPPQLRAALERYHGHPYAVEGALKLLRAGETIEGLPADPTPTRIAAEQWRRVRQAGPAAIRLFRAYAILEVPVPSDLAETVADVGAETRLSVLADCFLDGLLAREPDGESIYHALLADHVREDIADDQATQYHERAQEAYRHRLNADTRPDALAAARLPLHVLATGDVTSFAKALTSECMQPLVTLGLYDEAEVLSRQALKLVSPGSAAEAAVAGNLGNVYQTRGDLDQAEAMHRKSLAIEEKLGRLKGMAIAYGNLGIVYQTRGDLDQAEPMYRKSLAINEKLGHLEGMAANYSNLGVIYQTRGDLDQAEAMYRKSLAINEKLGRLAGMASTYGNLGVIYQTRGDLDQAEAMYRKSLAINEKLSRLEGMAYDYGNLGSLYQSCGDLDQARNLWVRAGDIFQQIGMPHMAAEIEGWLDGLDGKGSGASRA